MAHRLLPRRTSHTHILHLRPNAATSTATPPPPPPPREEVISLSKLILNSSDPKALARTLHSPAIQWTPDLVNAILKRIWNHGPKALQFFRILCHHPSYCHHASSFDHAVDISARLRDSRTLWALISRMRSTRVGPSSKTFAIIAESFEVPFHPLHRSMEIMVQLTEKKSTE